MRILYHHRTQAEDAQGVHIYEMINAFRKLGHTVDLVSLVDWESDRSEKTKGKRWEFVAKIVPNFVYELMEMAYNIVGYRLISRQIRHQKPDFIYERYSLNTFCGIWASKRYGIPLILEVNAPLYHEQKKYEKLTFEKFAGFSERWICSNSSKTIVVSSPMKKILSEEGVLEEHIVVMSNGINPDNFHPEIKGASVRRHHNIKDDKIIFGFIGWFRPWHGLDMILEIFKEDRLYDKNAHLILVGDGPAYESLHTYAEKHDLLNAVTFSGPVERRDVPKYIAAFDIALQPSVTTYASPMKIFEYMAMGKGVVAPRQDNICEILTDGIDALLFEPENKESLKDALNTLLNKKDMGRTLGRNACETIHSEKYFWITNAERSVELGMLNGDEAQSFIFKV